jgi:hypothetical protein
LPCSSKIHGRNVRKQSLTPSSIASLPIPDPRTWPEDVRRWFRQVTGEACPRDIFIFRSGAMSEMYLQDAITAICILEVDSSSWHTEGGYPVFQFASRLIEEYSRQLSACGYSVRILEPAGEQVSAPLERAEIIDISRARKRSL